MKHYILYQENGKILSCGSCDDTSFESMTLGDGILMMEGIANPNSQMVIDNSITNLPINTIGDNLNCDFDYNAKIWVLNIPRFSMIVRNERNRLLLESDWTQTNDQSETTKLKWKSYRQALRDISLQQDFPQNIEWPTKPE